MILLQATATILLFLLDDVGPADLKGPTFDRLAAEGVQFTRAYAQPWCAPARDSLYRSSWKGERHGGICPQGNESRYPTLQKLFQGHGVTTTLIGKAHTGSTNIPIPWPATPHVLGWDHWLMGQPVITAPGCSPAWPGVGYVVNDGEIELDTRHHTIREEEAAILARDGLIVVGFADAHSPWETAPYSTPASYAKRDLFEGEIASLDVAVGQIIAQHPGAWVIVLGDNGTPAEVDTDALRDSKNSVYEGGIRVPLIFHGPGLKPAVVDEVVSVVDIAPTLAQAMGWVVPDWMEGQSLLPLLTGGTVQRDWVYCENRSTGHAAVVEKNWKLVVKPKKHEVFDLRNDPGEQTALPAGGREYRRLLGIYQSVQ